MAKNLMAFLRGTPWPAMKLVHPEPPPPTATIRVRPGPGATVYGDPPAS